MIPIPTLQRAVEERHGCFALLREIVKVVERRDDGSDWDGAVVVFSLAGHPAFELAYAWCDPGPQPDQLELHVAIRAGTIDSPQKAVRRMLRSQRIDTARVS